MINRPDYLKKLISLQKSDAVVVITGVRRCGKSTLLQLYAEHLIQEGTNESDIVTIN